MALLRGINVGGHRKVPMATLRAAYTAAGCSAVATYIQSGNVVFDHAETDPDTLGATLEEAVRQACDVDSRLVLRNASEWTEMLDANPFITADLAYLNVTFLVAAPDAAQVADIESRDLSPDRVRVIGRHLYAWLPDGVQAARFSGVVAERVLGPGTARNWRTITKITDLVTARAMGG